MSTNEELSSIESASGEPMEAEEAYLLLLAAVLAAGGRIFIPNSVLGLEFTGTFTTRVDEAGMTIQVKMDSN